MSFFTPAPQPGSKSMEHDSIEPTASPSSRQKILEKKELQNLNNRLELYVQNQRNKGQTIEQLKNTIAKQEIEFRNKNRDKENEFSLINDKLRNENEGLQYQTNQLRDELQTLQGENGDLQKRVTASDKRASEKEAQIDGLKHQNTSLNGELQTVRAENHDIKYKYDNYDSERKQLMQQLKSTKDKNANLMRELTKRQSENRSQNEAFDRFIKEKKSEYDSLFLENNLLKKDKEDIQTKLRIEFDDKLSEFTTKREEQYKQEKEEWMRIFKQEFSRKLRSYKDANNDLSANSKKLEQDLIELQARLSKLKQSKTELEITMRNNEEEYDKLRCDLDELRKSKDNEIKQKTQLIADLREQKKQRDIEFDEVVGIKLQLAQEIELYRRILSEAEKSAGYCSPLDSRRKRRKLNNGRTQLMGTINNNNNLNNLNNLNDLNNNNINNNYCPTTPGIVRGAQLARQDLSQFNTNDENDMNENNNDNNNNISKVGQKRKRSEMYDCDEMDEMDEMDDFGYDGSNDDNITINSNDDNIEIETETDGGINETDMTDVTSNEEKECESDENDNDSDMNMMDDNMDDITPGGESYPLQFSTMDLTKSILEIQNISDSSVLLDGYTLSNSDGSAQFPLPNGRELTPNEKLTIMIGLRCKPMKGSLLWKADVWTGDEDDIARLYDPQSHEIARIEITPDMLPEKVKGRCNIM